MQYMLTFNESIFLQPIFLKFRIHEIMHLLYNCATVHDPTIFELEHAYH